MSCASGTVRVYDFDQKKFIIKRFDFSDTLDIKKEDVIIVAKSDKRSFRINSFVYDDGVYKFNQFDIVIILPKTTHIEVNCIF